MKQRKEILAQISLEKADEALKAGYDNIDISLTVAQNRAYYAVFYIAMALAYLDDFVTKSHHKLMGQFNKRYMYDQKLFDKEIINIYKTLIKNRESSDYNFNYKVRKEIVLKDIEKAKIFVEAVKPYILEKLAKENE